jgi:heterodisulfide reductase subunit A
MVVGGGISGMASALSLARQGFDTHIIEKNDALGGQALKLHKTAQGEEVQPKLAQLVQEVADETRITSHLNTTVAGVEGFVGNFKTTLSSNGSEEVLEHGVVVMATGASELKPAEYGYGQTPKIVTGLELDQKFIAQDPGLARINSAVFIQCVGSRDSQRPYCSRVCCTHSIHSALELKKLNPEMSVFILYRDIRTYGEKEYLYKEARAQGVLFVRYSLENKPQVKVSGDTVTVTAIDHVIGKPIAIEADLVTLASAILPNKDKQLADFFKVPMNDENFFIERHAKLGPSEFSTDGIYLCGMAHYPKPIDESIAQGKAAAARAVTLLAKEKLYASGTVAETDPMLCSSCGVCVSVCPYAAPSFIAADARMFAGKAEINPVLCKGCGLCVASCRSGAIHLRGFDNDQIFAQIFSMADALGN